MSRDGRDGAIRVPFVEDDDNFREALSWQLEERGFSVQGFAEANRSWQRSMSRPMPNDPPPDKQLVSGKLVLRPTVSRAYWGATDMRLTVGEYDIVQLLASNAGEHVSYRSIYDCMHYEGFIAGAGTISSAPGLRAVGNEAEGPEFELGRLYGEAGASCLVQLRVAANATSMRMRRS